MSTEVGSAEIPLHADGSALTPEAKKAAKEAAKAASGEKIKYGAEVDDKEVRRQAKRAADLASFRSKVSYDAELDTGRLQAEARIAAKAAAQKVEFKADLDRRGITMLGGSFLSAKGEALDFGAVIDALAKPLKDMENAGGSAGDALMELAGSFKSLKDPRIIAAGVVALGAAISLAVPFVVALSGGLVALAGAIAEAAGAAVSAAAPIAAIGVAAVTAKIGLSGMDDAFKAVAKRNKEVAETGKASEATLIKMKAALKNLAPEAAAFVIAIDKIRPAWEKLRRSVQGAMFEGLAQQIQTTANAALPALSKSLSGIGAQINDAAEGFLRWAGSEANISRITGLIDGLRGILGNLLRAAGNVGDGLLTLFTGALPSGQRLGSTIEGWSKSFQTWATNVTKSGGFQEFVDHAMNVAGDLWDIIKNIGSSIATVFGAGAPTGEGFLKTISDATGKFADFLKTPEGQAKLATWFADAKQAFGDLGDALKIMGPIIESVFKWWKENGKEVSQNFKDAAPVIQAMADDTVSLIDALSKFTDWGMLTGPSLDFGAIGGALDGLDAKITTWVETTRGKFTGWVSTTAGQFGGWVSSTVASIGTWVNETSQKIIDWINDTQARFVAWVTGLPSALAGLATRLWEGAGDMAAAAGAWLFHASRVVGDWLTNLPSAMAGLAVRLWQGAGDLASAFAGWVAGTAASFAAWVRGLPQAATGLATRIIAAAGSLAAAVGRWIAALPGVMVALVGRLIAAFAGLASRMIARAGSIAAAAGRWLSTLPGAAVRAAQGMGRAFAGLAGRMIAGAGDIASAVGRWLSGLPAAAGRAAEGIIRAFESIPGRIVSAFSGLAGRITSAIGTIVPKWSLPAILRGGKKTAMGGVFDTPQLRLIGEAGPEAVVPLRRNAPLAPDVATLLRSVAAGHGMGGGSGSSGVADGPPVTINVQLPTGDPQAAAMAVMNRLATRLAV